MSRRQRVSPTIHFRSTNVIDPRSARRLLPYDLPTKGLTRPMPSTLARLEHCIPPPFLALGTAVVMWGLSRLGPPSSVSWQRRVIIAALLVIIAAVFVAPAIRAFRRAATTINPVAPDTASTLVTTGIYQVTRNPMYVALALMLTAWAAWLCQ